MEKLEEGQIVEDGVSGTTTASIPTTIVVRKKVTKGRGKKIAIKARAALGANLLGEECVGTVEEETLNVGDFMQHLLMAYKNREIVDE